MNIVEKKILTALKNSRGMTITKIASKIGLERHTTVKYLEQMRAHGMIDFIEEGKSKVWNVTDSQFIEKIKKNDPIVEQFKNIFKNVEENISIQDNNFKVIWSNKNSVHEKCHEMHAGSAEKCRNCPVAKTWKSGKSETSIVELKDGKRKIIAQPILDDNNNTIAVVEIIK